MPKALAVGTFTFVAAALFPKVRPSVAMGYGSDRTLGVQPE